MIGMLRLHGKEKNLTVLSELELDGKSPPAREFIAIDRSHFGVRWGEFSPGRVVVAEANVVFQFEALKTCWTQGGP